MPVKPLQVIPIDARGKLQDSVDIRLRGAH
jgi:hypothetical protein